MLDVKGVGKSFGKLAALSNVSFSVEEGEVFGIAGPNGAGKSTLFNVVTGVYPPSEGNVMFQGRNISNLASHRICHLGIGRTFQTPAVFSSLSIRDNIRVGSTFGNAKHGQLARVMEFMDLGDKADAPIANQDLFTTKMTMIGAVLATDCKLLMLDEPMAGFSVAEINRFTDVVRRINQEWGITIVIIEHLLDILISMTERMMILHYGSPLYIGDSDDVTKDRRVVKVYLGTDEEADDA